MRLLLRFRMHKIGLASDIEKAFLQVGLQETERDVTRFLWLKDLNIPQAENNLQVLRFTRVPFGVLSSSFLLGATILYHLKKKEAEVAKKIERDIYMVNVITGENSTKKAVTFYHEAKLIFQNASMNLRECISNSEDFLSNIPQIDRVKEKNVKILSMCWNTCIHSLTITGLPTIQLKVNITKRDLPSMIAAIFNPLGYLCPVIIKAKIFMQQLWEKNMSWDDPLTTSLRNEWAKIVNDLQNLSKIQIPRYVNTERDGTERYQLICFCDASGKLIQQLFTSE